MDRNAANDTTGNVVPFPTVQRLGGPQVASGGPRRRGGGERRPVEELLGALKGRRGRLEDRLALLSLAIEKLEVQVETKRNLEILPGIS